MGYRHSIMEQALETVNLTLASESRLNAPNRQRAPVRTRDEPRCACFPAGQPGDSHQPNRRCERPIVQMRGADGQTAGQQYAHKSDMCDARYSHRWLLPVVSRFKQNARQLRKAGGSAVQRVPEKTST